MEAVKPKNNKSVRFSDAPWYKPGLQMTVGGCGGIGSWLSFFLGRQEAALLLYDMDIIDETNLGGQLFSQEDIGSNKAEVMVRKIQGYSGNEGAEALGRFETGMAVDDICFAAFDNMASRKALFEDWAKLKTRKIFIDGRLLAEIGQIYCVKPGQEDEYRKTLFEDTEVDTEMCSYKSTTHCSALIASLMTSCLNNHMTNLIQNMDIRDVPFQITYELPLLTFNVT